VCTGKGDMLTQAQRRDGGLAPTESQTRHYEDVSGRQHSPVQLYPPPPFPGKNPYSFSISVRSGRTRKMSPPPEFGPRTVQPIARCYTAALSRPPTVPEYTTYCTHTVRVQLADLRNTKLALYCIFIVKFMLLRTA
jgi:hypothetical protein